VGNTPPGSPVRCTINVTFTPTGTGQRTGVLSTGPGGPTAFLTGKGVGLKLDLTANKQELKKKIKFFAAANGDSVLIAKGDVKRKTKQLAEGEKTKVKAKLKKKVFKRLKKRLNRGKKASAVVKGKATTSSGLVAKDKVKVKFTK
jgi:predicted DNA-binding antitoxin AbrB/MazE fold protein